MIKFEVMGNIYTFTKHVNVIGGTDGMGFNSGTCKTYFYRRLVEEQLLGRIVTSNKIFLAQSPYAWSGIQLSSNYCVIIDEANFAPRELINLFEAVRKANAYLVVIGRMHVKQLVYSVDSIFKLNDDFSLSQVFTTFDRDVNEHDEKW